MEDKILKTNKEMFKDKDIKNTKQRSIVLDILKDSQETLTAEEIFLKAKAYDETISLSTIYRTLTLFDESQIVIKMAAIEENLSKYKINDTDHAHYLLCLNCNKKIEVSYCPLSVYENKLKESHNFYVSGHKLEIYGYCEDCAKERL